MAWLYQRPGSENWWMGWRLNGRQFLKSTGESDKTKAQAKLRTFELLEHTKADGKLTEEFIQSLTGRRVATVTLKSALDQWISEAQGSTSPRTWEKYKAVADAFREALQASEKGPLLQDVETEEIRQFLTRKRATASASTVNQHRKILSSFFIRCLKNGLIKANPVLPVKPFKAGEGEKQARRALTLEELQLIFSKAPNAFWRYMILAGFYTGLRMSDLIKLKWGEVDLGDSVLRLTASKTGKRLHIPIAAPLRSMLGQLREQAGKPENETPLWPAEVELHRRHDSKVFSNEFYTQVLIPAGLGHRRSHLKTKNGRSGKRDNSGLTFHCLRHTFVSYLKITGSNNAVAKELAGHSSDTVNNLYTHIPMETLASAVRQLPGIDATDAKP